MARAVSDKAFFIGREAEQVEVCRHLEEGARLVSIVGHGGMGKTRLALRCASAWVERGGRSAFVDLAEARRAGDVIGAVSAALGASLESVASDEDAARKLGAVMAASRDRIVVLDNAETVAAELSALLDLWLDDVAGARLLVTSRVRLDRPDPVVDLRGLSEDEGVALFEGHARRRVPDFQANEDTRALVRRLDGSPLAIELAAARAHVLPPAALLERFSRHIDLVAGNRVARQASLRAVVAGSWALSTAAEQRALATFSVFAGSFTLDAAERVLAAVDADQEASAMIASLADKSLIHVDTVSRRCAMTESVRSYAMEQLAADPERSAHARRAHATFFLDVAASGAPLDALVEEREQLAAAFRESPQAALALEPVFAIDRTAKSLLTLFSSALARESLAPAARSELWIACAVVERRLGRPPATLEAVTRALPLAAEAGRADLEARALALRAWAVGDLQGPRAARAEAEASVEAARRAGDAALLAKALQQLAWFELESGDAVAAEAHAEETLALAEDLGVLEIECLVHNLLGSLASTAGRTDAADAHFERALSAARRSKSAINEVTVLAHRARLLAARGDRLAARDVALQALDGSRAGGFRRVEGVALLVLAGVELEAGDIEAAHARALHAERVLAEVGYRRHRASALRLLGDIALREGRTDAGLVLLRRAREESAAIADADGEARADAALRDSRGAPEPQALGAANQGAAESLPVAPRYVLVTRTGVLVPDRAVDAASFDLFFDAVERQAHAGGARVDLRKKPIAARILEVLLADPTTPFDKARLFEEVWRTKFRVGRAPTLYKAIDRLAELLDPDPHRFFRWDEEARLVLTAARTGLLRLVDIASTPA